MESLAAIKLSTEAREIAEKVSGDPNVQTLGDLVKLPASSYQGSEQVYRALVAAAVVEGTRFPSTLRPVGGIQRPAQGKLHEAMSSAGVQVNSCLAAEGDDFMRSARLLEEILQDGAPDRVISRVKRPQRIASGNHAGRWKLGLDMRGYVDGLTNDRFAELLAAELQRFHRPSWDLSNDGFEVKVFLASEQLAAEVARIAREIELRLVKDRALVEGAPLQPA